MMNYAVSKLFASKTITQNSTTLNNRIQINVKQLACFALILLCVDIESNPGPTNFSVCTLNSRSILQPPHHPDLVRLSETWIKPSTTITELSHCTPPKYTLVSFRRSSSGNTSAIGTAFLVHEPFTQLPTSHSQISSFEHGSITLKLPHTKLSVLVSLLSKKYKGYRLGF